MRHAALITLCKNVEHVEIRGYDGCLLDELKAALAKAPLVSFRVERFGLTGRTWATNMFCSQSDLVMLMPNWPRIKKLDMPDYDFDLLGDESGEILPEPYSVAGCCPALTDLAFLGDLPSVHWNLLSRMAPAVQRLEIRIQANYAPQILRCIETWSSTLKYFKLFIKAHGGRENVPSPAQVHISLSELRYLLANSAVIPPSNFSNFSRLESVDYEFASAEDARELACIVRNRVLLLFLQKITHNPYLPSEVPKDGDNSFLDAITELQTACKARNIKCYDFNQRDPAEDEPARVWDSELDDFHPNWR